MDGYIHTRRGRSRRTGQSVRRELKKQGMIQLFVISGMIYLVIFNLIPMFGLIMGFKDYKITDGISGIFTSEWVGFDYFTEFVTDYKFGRLVRNTVALSVLKLIFTFPLPILFAIMLNEIKRARFKKLVQTCSYLPHFISWVIISSLAFQFLSRDGVINTLLEKAHLIETPVGFLTDKDLFWGLAVFLDVWKEMGWWTIIFLAAIVGINQDYYEAAQIDGASRIQRIRYITLPCIKGTIVVVLIMTMGNLFGGGLSGSNFEQCYLLGNSVNADTSEIIQTYVFDVGLAQGRYAYATAVGMIQSVISLGLIFASNFAAKRLSGTSLF